MRPGPAGRLVFLHGLFLARLQHGEGDLTRKYQSAPLSKTSIAPAGALVYAPIYQPWLSLS